MNESEPLLPTTTNSSDEGECSPTGAKKWQFRTGAMLESEALHKVVLALVRQLFPSLHPDNNN